MQSIFPKILSTGEKIDIKKLNEYHRKLALEGRNASKKNKVDKSCNSCEKDIKTTDGLKCHMCKKLTHKECASKSMSNEGLERAIVKKNLACDKCYSSPVFNEDIEDEVNTLLSLAYINEESMDQDESSDSNEEIVLSEDIICTNCDFKALSEDLLRKHILDVHSVVLEIQCEFCGDKLESQTNLKNHISSDHSLTCLDCWKNFNEKEELESQNALCSSEWKPAFYLIHLAINVKFQTKTQSNYRNNL